MPIHLKPITVFVFIFSFFSTTALAGSFNSRNLSIHSDLGGTIGACDLGATLLIPSQLKPSALVILAAGSGPNDRDEHQAGASLYPFKDIAEALSSANVATLRFDKRESIPKCQPPMANNPELPYPTIDDLKNVVRYAKTYPLIKELPLILLGHSSGVTDVLAVASSGEFVIKNLILLAGMGKYSVDQELIRQFKAILATPGLSVSQKSAYQADLIGGEVFFEKIQSGSAVSTDEFLGLYTQYWSDWIQVTSQDTEMASALRSPSLLLQGDNDTNITLDDFNALKSAIDPIQGSKAVLFTRLNHDFVSPGENHVDVRVTAAILNWLSETSSSATLEKDMIDKTRTAKADVVSEVDSNEGEWAVLFDQIKSAIENSKN